MAAARRSSRTTCKRARRASATREKPRRHDQRVQVHRRQHRAGADGRRGEAAGRGGRATVDASFFRSYKLGTIYNVPCVEVKNYCLIVVGYDNNGKNKFWIAKNSFNNG